ncbi:MAG: hypothetical protein H6679_00855 [Epsilonproteobacteria bacterium]|nr:hypothetical protein [Campylobacterota bacterium]
MKISTKAVLIFFLSTLTQTSTKANLGKKIVILALAILTSATTYPAEKQQHLYNFLCYLKQTVPESNHPNIVRSVAFGYYGILLETYLRQHERITLPHNAYINSIAFNPSGTLIATACDDGTTNIWDICGIIICQIPQKNKRAYAIDFTSDDQIMTIYYNNPCQIKLWNTKGELIESREFPEAVYRLFATSDLSVISTASALGIRVVEVHTPEKKFLIEHNDEINSVVFSHDKQYIATASDDGTTKVYTQHGELIKKISHGNWITGVTLSHHNNFIITTSSRNGEIKIWDFNGNLVIKLSAEDTVTNVAIDPYEKFFVTDCSWLVTLDGKILKRLTPNANSKVLFSPDGKLIALACVKKSTVKLFPSPHYFAQLAFDELIDLLFPEQ